MVELIIIACAFVTSGQPTCREHVLTFENVSVAQCVNGSQLALAQWKAEHENEQIKRFYCQKAKQFGKA